MNYNQFQQILSSTNCHKVRLLNKNGKECIGVYNGLSFWGEIFSFINGKDEYAGVSEVEKLTSEWDEEDNKHYYFTEQDFKLGGYTIL